jgi:hypothetical protein
MRDLRRDLENLWRNLRRMPSAGGGRVVMFISAHEGEGTTSLAGSVALMAEARSQRAVWLLDLDLETNSAFFGFENGFAGELGQPDRAFDAALGLAGPCQASRAATRGQGGEIGNQHLLCAHQIGTSRLLVTRLRGELLSPGQHVRFRPQADWWQALRSKAEWTIVNAPSLERSGVGLGLASEVDGVILVVRSDRTRADAAAMARDEIEANGGQVLGVVMTGVGGDARLMQSLGG